MFPARCLWEFSKDPLEVGLSGLLGRGFHEAMIWAFASWNLVGPRVTRCPMFVTIGAMLDAIAGCVCYLTGASDGLMSENAVQH